jgi:hypothetical protein
MSFFPQSSERDSLEYDRRWKSVFPELQNEQEQLVEKQKEYLKENQWFNSYTQLNALVALRESKVDLQTATKLLRELHMQKFTELQLKAFIALIESGRVEAQSAKTIVLSLNNDQVDFLPIAIGYGYSPISEKPLPETRIQMHLLVNLVAFNSCDFEAARKAVNRLGENICKRYTENEIAKLVALLPKRTFEKTNLETHKAESGKKRPESQKGETDSTAAATPAPAPQPAETDDTNDKQSKCSIC